MLGRDAITTLKQLLWGSEERVYALLDGASVPGLLDRLYGDPRPQFECLMHGDLAPDMAEVAPYLVALDPASELADWVLAHGWGNHWGSFALTRRDLRTLWFHLRNLNIVYGPDGKPMLFRYYDPRVLRIFLPTCEPEQLAEMFGPVTTFVTEADAPGTALTFALAAGELQAGSRRIAAS